MTERQSDLDANPCLLIFATTAKRRQKLRQTMSRIWVKPDVVMEKSSAQTARNLSSRLLHADLSPPDIVVVEISAKDSQAMAVFEAFRAVAALCDVPLITITETISRQTETKLYVARVGLVIDWDKLERHTGDIAGLATGNWMKIEVEQHALTHLWFVPEPAQNLP
jgi:hypothetical protein